MRFVLKEVDKKHLALIPGGGGKEEQPEYDENPWEQPSDPEPHELGEKPQLFVLKNKETP